MIAFDADAMATAYVNSTKLQWPLLLDSDRKLYAAYGMSRGSWWNIYKPASILKYLWLIFSGTRPGKPGSDWRQLGGNVLIDPESIVRLHYVSADPHDRPNADSILEIVGR